MPRNRQSDDIDHVPIDAPTSKPSKKPVPEPWPLPFFEPLQIENSAKHGKSRLPLNVDTTSPYAIFSLFLTNEILSSLAQNTNEYAVGVISGLKPTEKWKARPWKPTSAGELKAYIATYIYMGIHKCPRIEDYWNTSDISPFHPISKYISIVRWQQIDRFFRICSAPDPKRKNITPFEKIEPLNEQLRVACRQLFLPGIHLAIDESIQPFTGRASEIVNIPSKPYPEGFKLWMLANNGYVVDWMFHAKGSKKGQGPLGLSPKWATIHGFSKTEGVVLELLQRNGFFGQRTHVVWMDNLFTSARLLSFLRDHGVGAAGTVRRGQTKREQTEGSRGSEAQKSASKKEPQRGLDPSLSELKSVFNADIPWGRLYSTTSNDDNVIQFAWKDSQTVLFMSTVTDGKDTQLRMHRRPAMTATNAKTTRIPFGGEATKELEIPQFIDMYNHFMGGVDQHDQLRGYYSTQRTHYKTWKPLWHALLDIIIINSYIISRDVANPSGKRRTHKGFREELSKELFEHSTRSSHQPPRSQQSVTYLSEHKHGKIEYLDGPKKECYQCSLNQRPRGMRGPRKALSELKETTNGPNGVRRRRERYPVTSFGCRLCGIHLCKYGQRSGCWSEHIQIATARDALEGADKENVPVSRSQC